MDLESAGSGLVAFGEITGEIRNFGGLAGATFSDLLFSFFGLTAYFVPVLAGIIAAVALRPRAADEETPLTWPCA